MVQGPRRISDKVNRTLGLDAAKVDAVLLSHAHIDHSGSLPRLVKLGFAGRIHCTEATKDLCEILLADSAHIQASDARYLKKKGKHFDPPYDQKDVDHCIDRMQGVPYNKSVDVLDGVSARFLESGHILGSAFIVIDVDDGQRKLSIVFTGDHGRRDMPILKDPARIPLCDVLITESTYGDRLHAKTPDMERKLEEIVNEEIKDGGRILWPAFSVGRTQNVLMHLGKLIKEGRIPRQQIYIDSPLSQKATSITARHPEVFDKELRTLLEQGHQPFNFDGVRYVQDVEESKSLNDLRSGIIISASGMCEAGRILHHMKQTIGRREDCILAVGFMAHGTLGRKLIEKYPYVKIFGQRYKVNCKVRSISGLSAHADYSELLESFDHLDRSTRVFVVHGEEDAAMKFADRLQDAGFGQVDVPVRKEKFVV